MEPSLLDFDYSSFVDLDVTGFPETWLQDGIFPDLPLDSDFHDAIPNSSPQEYLGHWSNAPDRDYQPASNSGYVFEELLTTSSGETLPKDPSETSLSQPFYREMLDLAITEPSLFEQPAVDPCSEPPAVLCPSFPRAATKKRRRLSEFTREKAKSVRRVGACLRCRIYKEPCDGSTPCQNCAKKAGSMRVFRQPCYREFLGNVVPFRLSNSSLGQTRATYPKLQWSNGDLKAVEISLTPSFGPHEVTPTVKFQLRKFNPEPRDNIDFEWSSGGLLKTLKMPAYAIPDIKEAYSAIENFLNHCQPHLEDYIWKSTEDEILTLTMAEAHRYADLHNNDYIRRALKIRAFAVRRTEVQQSELDIPVIDDEECLHNGHRPMPRFLNYQVDMMMNFVIDAHRKAVLKRLKTLIFGKNIIKAWYEAYLLTYLLLSTIEHACQWQHMYSAKRKDTQNYLNVNFVTRSNLEEWQYSAEILIAHFRCIMRGQLPFSDDSKIDESCRRAGLDEHSTTYVRRIMALVKGRAMQKAGSGDIASPYIWLPKLFLAKDPRVQSKGEA